jgi:signal transduction histidine kinase
VPLLIAEQIAAIKDVLMSGLGSQVRLAVDVPAATWLVKADPNELEIALVNLVLNARDAMPDGGIVTITAENVEAAAGAAPSGERVAITAANTGVGIAPDVLERIFEPFLTTKAVGKGTGLGLSQVFGFAHQAGGTVKAESTLGNGTRMTLSLPRAHERAPREDHDAHLPATTARSFSAGRFMPPAPAPLGPPLVPLPRHA